MEGESAGRHDWLSQKFCNDIATINSIEAVPSILQVFPHEGRSAAD
jgi:hypothetical protein